MKDLGLDEVEVLKKKIEIADGKRGRDGTQKNEKRRHRQLTHRDTITTSHAETWHTGVASTEFILTNSPNFADRRPSTGSKRIPASLGPAYLW